MTVSDCLNISFVLSFRRTILLFGIRAYMFCCCCLLLNSTFRRTETTCLLNQCMWSEDDTATKSRYFKLVPIAAMLSKMIEPVSVGVPAPIIHGWNIVY